MYNKGLEIFNKKVKENDKIAQKIIKEIMFH